MQQLSISKNWVSQQKKIIQGILKNEMLTGASMLSF
jgi:hypothetical protein